MNSVELPRFEDVAKEIQSKINIFLDPATTSYLDIRLQVEENGRWNIRVGDPQNDNDHLGFWGSTSIRHDSDLLSITKDLLEEVREDAIDKGYMDKADMMETLYEPLIGSLNRLAFDLHKILTDPMTTLDWENIRGGIKEAVKLLEATNSDQTWMDQYK